MNGLRTRLATAVMTALLSGFGGCLGTGCHLGIGHDGEYGFKQSSRWGVYYTAKETTDVKATIEVEAPALVEWIMGPPAPESDGD